MSSGIQAEDVETFPKDSFQFGEARVRLLDGLGGHSGRGLKDTENLLRDKGEEFTCGEEGLSEVVIVVAANTQPSDDQIKRD